MDHAPGGLISWRAEKSAISALKLGHDLFYCGPGINNKSKTFIKTYEINWAPGARMGLPYYWHSVKKQVGRILKEVKPDIVHANNIFAAKMISEFKVPFIYDAHEYWSLYVKTQVQSHNSLNNSAQARNSLNEMVLRKLALFRKPKRVIRGLSRRLKSFSIVHTDYASLVLRWEKEIVSSAPTIVTTELVAKELRTTNNSKSVFTVPNFPNVGEIKDFPKPEIHRELSSTFAGMGSIKAAHKNMEGLTDLFEKHDIGTVNIIGMEGGTSQKVRFMGFLPTRQAMYNEMFNHSIGLIPFKRHWIHPYVSLSKAYEYAHAGLFVLCTSSYETIIEDLKEGCAPFYDYEEMSSKLVYLKDNLEELYSKRQNMYQFARQNLIWEKYEKNLFDAYRLC
jgi:glycosyltransferase involved in cell wall biosynthesis